jgi:hypothetical protein
VAADDSALEALHALRAALGTTDEWLRHAINRTNEIEGFRDRGYSWRQVLSTEERPLMSEIVHRHITLLDEVNNRFRREEVRCLYSEGVKVAEIAAIARGRCRAPSPQAMPPKKLCQIRVGFAWNRLPDRTKIAADLGFVVGVTGLEPVTSSV